MGFEVLMTPTTKICVF